MSETALEVDPPDCRDAGPPSVRPELPGVGVVGHGQIEDLDQPPAQHVVLHRDHRLDPAVQAPLHEVGRADGHRQWSSGRASEAEHPRMLEEPVDHRPDPDVLGQTRHPGAQAAAAADDHVDRRPGPGGPVEGIDHLGVGQSVHLQDDAPVRSGVRLAVDPGDDPAPQRHGGHHQPTEFGRLPEARHVVEQGRHVGREDRVPAQQPEVLVTQCRPLVVVARRHVAVPVDPVGLLAGHERHLGVGLQPLQPVDHLDPRGLQGPGPADVGPLVERRLQLHHHRHLLARLGGPDERRDDRALARGPVERLLDRQHLRVRRRLVDEGLDRTVVGVIGVMEEDLPVPQRIEHTSRTVDRGRPSVVDHARRELRGGDRVPGPGGQIGPVQADDGPQASQVDRHVQFVDALGGDPHLLDQDVAELVGAVRGHLEPHRLAEPPTLELHLHGGRQVVGLVLLDRQISVAGHPEGVVLPDGHGREQRVQVCGDHLLEGDEPFTVGQHHEARQHRRHLDPGDTAGPADRVGDPHHQVE